MRENLWLTGTKSGLLMFKIRFVDVRLCMHDMFNSVYMIYDMT